MKKAQAQAVGAQKLKFKAYAATSRFFKYMGLSWTLLGIYFSLGALITID